jgi:hypothetical protein
MRVTIRHLVARNNRSGDPRYYWLPTSKLKQAGWRAERLSNDEGQAIARAKELNDELDGWYATGRPHRGSVVALDDTGPANERPRGSVWQLIDLYRRPPHERLAEDPERREGERRVFGYDYAGLEKATKRSYDASLDYIGQWLGPLPVRKITETIVLEHLKALAAQRHTKGPNKGRRKVATAMLIGRVGRLLFHASRTLVDPVHPCYVRKDLNPWANLRAREHREKPVLWTREARDMFLAAAERLEWRSISTAIRINWWLGQREADILALGHNFDPAEILQVVQSKTAGIVHLPVAIVPEITTAVETLREDQRARNLSGIRLLIDERNGLLWDEHRFRKAFQDVRVCAMEEARVAGRSADWIATFLEPLTFMRLRHTVVTMLYRAGATVPEIGSITGHTISSVERIIERYGVRDEVTAGNALQKRLNREGK